MRKNLFVLIPALAGLSWLLAAPDQAFGQGETWAGTSLAQMVEGARWRFGTLRVNAAFNLLNAGYDSDVFYGYFDKPVPDATFSASVPIQVLLPLSKKAVLDIFDSPQYVFYLDTKTERAWNNTFEGQLHLALNRFYIQAGGGYSNVRQRLSPELNINIRQKEDSLNGTILWQASRGVSLALLYGGSQYDYGDAEFGGTSIAESLNRREDYFDIIAYVQPNPQVRFHIDGQYGKYSFRDAAASFRDARSYRVLGGFDFIPKEGGANRVGGIQGSASLGYMKIDFLDPEQVDGSGFAGDVNLSIGIMKLTTARVFFSRGFPFSVYSGAAYYISMNYGAGITRLLSRRASLSYELSFGRSTYPEDVGGGGVPQGIRYTTHMASLNITLARNLAISFLGTIGKRAIDASSQVRDRNFFGFNLIYGATRGTISAPTGGLSP